MAKFTNVKGPNPLTNKLKKNKILENPQEQSPFLSRPIIRPI